MAHELIISGIYSAIMLIAISILMLGLEGLRPIHTRVIWRGAEFQAEKYFLIMNYFIMPVLLALPSRILAVIVLEIYVPYHLLNMNSIIGQWPLYLQIGIGLLVLDLILYWRHRFSHHFFWSFHRVHHNARELTWMTHYRIHPIEMLFIILVETLVLYFIGLSGPAILYAGMCIQAISLFEHTNIHFYVPSPWKYIVGNPFYHRWHHALEPEAVNKNYAVMFPFIDKLFGTYYCPDRLPKEYGIFNDNCKTPAERSFWALIKKPFE